jgi:transcriptional regulator with XRE-family HTH domain
MANAKRPDNRRRAVSGLDETFGRRVREERERRRMPQQHIATVLGAIYGFTWHQTTVAKVEAGERPVKLAEALAISYVLEVPLDELIDGQGHLEMVPTSARGAVHELSLLEQYVVRRRHELGEG